MLRDDGLGSGRLAFEAVELGAADLGSAQMGHDLHQADSRQ